MRARSRRSSASLLVTWLAALVTGHAAAVSLEYEVKAAFLLNFTRFVEWPDGTLFAGRPFTVCLLGSNPFDAALDATLADETWNGHPFVQRVVTTSGEIGACQLLFVPRDQADAFARLGAAGARVGLLTIGEGPEFLRDGGVINLVLEQNRVRFDIEARAAGRAGLRVSSKLLRLARTVRGDPGGRP